MPNGINGHTKINDIVKINDDRQTPGEIWIVTDIDESRFTPEGGWYRTLTLESLGGGMDTSIDEGDTTTIVTDKKLQQQRRTLNDLPDPRTRLFH